MSDRERIRAYLARFNSDEEWLSSDDIFATGVVDSMIALELVIFLEKTFGITIEEDDLQIENLCSVNGMLGMLERKRAMT